MSSLMVFEKCDFFFLLRDTAQLEFRALLNPSHDTCWNWVTGSCCCNGCSIDKYVLNVYLKSNSLVFT